MAAPGDCTYTGEVVQFEREELLPRSMGREQLGIADHQRLVYLSAGGGGDPNAEETLRSLVNAFRSQDDIHLLVGAGPLYRGQRLASPNLTWFDSPAVWRYFGTIDAAISAGGYNSFHELLFARVPTAFFSQAKIADDQQQRIRNAVQHGACQEISTPQNTDLVIKTTRELLDEEITARIRSACDNWIPENGARQCAIELLSPLYDAKQLDWASNVLSPALTHALERINGGTTGALADWLTPLAPQEQFQSLKNHSGLNDIMRHLSPAAAHEVEQILAKEKVHSSHFKFEATLLDLLNTIQSAAAALGVPARQLAEESLKTLNSAIKKQPPLAKQNNQQTPWACEVIKTVRFLLTLSISDCSAFDILQMFRIFPRVVDVNVGEAGMLFEHFMRHRIAMGDLPHAILQQIQLLKVLDTKITRERLESITEGIST